MYTQSNLQSRCQLLESFQISSEITWHNQTHGFHFSCSSIKVKIVIIHVKLMNPRHRMGNFRNREEFHRALVIRVVSYIVLACPIGKPRDSIVGLRTRAKSTENAAFWAFHTEKSDHPGPTRGRGSNLIGKARLGPSRCM